MKYSFRAINLVEKVQMITVKYFIISCLSIFYFDFFFVDFIIKKKNLKYD